MLYGFDLDILRRLSLENKEIYASRDRIWDQSKITKRWA